MRLLLSSSLKFYFFVLVFFWVEIITGQVVEFDWAKGIGGTGTDIGNSTTVDSNGNVYTIGYFSGTADFDPGSGIFNLTSAGSFDIFVSKLDPSGSFLWAKKIGGTGDDRGNSITVDINDNIYATGYFSGAVDFDSNIGVFNLISTGFKDIFILKLDALGTFLWAKKMGGVDNDYGASIAVDISGNVYTTGAFKATVDFDPETGVYNLSTAGSVAAFISKLDASGAFLWAKSMGGTNGGTDGVSSSSIAIDASGNVYTTGSFYGTVDFDPGAGVFNLTVWLQGSSHIFISKLDASGALVWVKQIGDTGVTSGNAISIDITGDIYVTGTFSAMPDFNPGPGVFYMSPTLAYINGNNYDAFILKLNSSGSFLWAQQIGSSSNDYGYSIAVDLLGNVYTIGTIQGLVYFNHQIGVFNLASAGAQDVFISKLDSSGSFLWAERIGGPANDKGYSISIDASGNIYATGYFEGTAYYNQNSGIGYLTSTGAANVFTLKLNQKNISSIVFQDFSQNCIKESNEASLANRLLIINPGNLIVTTNNKGIGAVDSLPAGTYTITADTSSPNWQITCPVTQFFTVVHPDSFTIAPAFGFVSTSPCPSPAISIHAPTLRPGFLNQDIYIRACNDFTGSGILDSAFVIVELDPLLTVQSGSQPYTPLGNNQFRINLGALYPGQCIDFSLSCHLSINAIIGQTLCMNATLHPLDSCALDDIPNPFPSTISPCNTAYDFSDLVVRPECDSDTIRFVITNMGDDDMTCFSQVRLLVDGVLMMIDSVQLAVGDTAVFAFAGDGRTWRLEVDQHPLHPGNSLPSATIELCGNASNWTSNLFNILPHNDADPQIDIYCGLVTGSFDPNDKTGYPLGIGNSHDILPNQEMEYVIRFQNTGTDTAFTVVIRDTLSMDLDIFSVQSGASSHDYDFRMYGPRVLEWTFYNIMLPDSNVNEAASHGFVKFNVQQKADLTNGTRIENSAAIYFDFNAPIITNTSWHTIKNPLFNTINIEKIPAENAVFKVYPNPNTGQLYLEQKNNADIQILILDNLGRVLLSKQSNDVVTQLNISHLAAGIYYISVNNGKQISTEKIVKQ